MPEVMLSDELYERVARQARKNKRTVEEEVLAILEKPTTPKGEPLSPDEFFVTEEQSAPFDLPRPVDAVRVKARDGGPRQPDLLSLQVEEDQP